MRNRDIHIQFWLNRREAEALKRKAKKCHLTQAAYVRFLITGYIPRESPPLEYYSLIRELRAIGNNINQIAKIANITGQIDSAAYQQDASALYRTILKIQEAVLLPDKIEWR